MRVRRFLQLGSTAVCLACASIDGETSRQCEPVASLQPLPDVRSCDEGELAHYGSALREQVVERGSRALVRAEFDDTARVRSVCVEAAVERDAWRARRYLDEQSDLIANLPPGPACLADRRLDLNRYEAARAEIEHAGRLCGGQAGHFDQCMARHGEWIVRDRIGWTRPFLYVAPEVADPPELSAIETASRCARTTQGFESESECIQADGFEMLSPPPR